MRRYGAVFLVNLQHQLQLRASWLMERIRSLALVLSLYFLWKSLLSADSANHFLGYSYSQMMSYVLGLALLRAFVLSNRAFSLTWEIAQGRLSALLVRPINIFTYQLSLDLSDKAIQIVSAALEISILALILRAPLYVPQATAAALAAISIMLSYFLYFFISLTLSSSGFWTAESVGFLWAAGLLIEFASGAFFPLDVLPLPLKEMLHQSPFPYLVYFPLNIYLERLTDEKIIEGLRLQILWLAVFWLAAQLMWRLGLKTYQAEGG